MVTHKIGQATRDLHKPSRLIVAFLVPALALYSVFFIYPMLQSVYLSFFHGSPEKGEFAFVGLGNFQRLMHDSIFWTCLLHNLVFVLIGGTATIILGLAVALGLTHCGRGRSFFRIVFLFPNVMAAVAIAILWSFIYNPSFGFINGILRALGQERLAHAWLGEPVLALLALVVVHIWSSTGFYIVLFYAGLLRIPADFVEAAKIDGATWWQEFRHIRLPLLTDILRVATTYIVINSLNIFALVHLMNDGQANHYNDVLLTYLYQEGFLNGNFGYACAIAVSMLVVVLTSAFAVNLLFRDKEVDL